MFPFAAASNWAMNPSPDGCGAVPPLMRGLRRIARCGFACAAFVALPIAPAGDLLVNPISFALSSYPTGWLRTLEQLDALEAATIVPGHGAPLHTKTLLRAHIALFRELLRGGREAKAKGLSADEPKATMLPGLHDLQVQFTGDDAVLNPQFEVYLVDWHLHRVYDELNGPLSDEIAPIPRQD